jgi:hypothetical protein
MYLNDPKFGEYERAYLTGVMIESRAESGNLLSNVDCRIAKQGFARDAGLLRGVLKGYGWTDEKINLLTGPDQPSTPASPLAAAHPPMFQKGLADRTAWEQWISTLSGDYRAGAEYWAGQRSVSHPASCQGSAEFRAGCEAAKTKLATADAFRKSEPDYKLGWNLYGH